MDVIESNPGGWSHILYKGRERYMHSEDLLFLNAR